MFIVSTTEEKKIYKYEQTLFDYIMIIIGFQIRKYLFQNSYFLLLRMRPKRPKPGPMVGPKLIGVMGIYTTPYDA